MLVIVYGTVSITVQIVVSARAERLRMHINPTITGVNILRIIILNFILFSFSLVRSALRLARPFT